MLDIKDGKHCPEYLVDITKIKELKQIGSAGADDTHRGRSHPQPGGGKRACTGGRRVSGPGLLHGGFPSDSQFRTLAGNVVNAQPAADSAVPLVALGARARILTGREEGACSGGGAVRGVRKESCGQQQEHSDGISGSGGSGNRQRVHAAAAAESSGFAHAVRGRLDQAAGGYGEGGADRHGLRWEWDR